jgi:predicted nucleic acid-binding Zn ribbon protein
MCEVVQTKVCSKCKVEKPATLENFHYASKGKYNLRSVCKDCRREGRKWKWEMTLLTGKKICSSCNIEKFIDDFGKNSNYNDGLHSYCKICSNEKSNEWVKNNLEKRKEIVKKYTHSENVKEKRKIQYYNNPSFCSICEKIIPYEKSVGSQLCSDQCKEIRKTQITEYKKNWSKNKQNIDDLYALKIAIRKNFWTNFKKYLTTGKKISQTTIHILGCDWETLKKHLENQFSEGMSWDNQGRDGWHIDHIIPLSSAKTSDELYKLNHYTNLQPLWAKDNLKKSDKISEEWGNA